MTLVWHIWQIKEIRQTLICQLAPLILLIIGCRATFFHQLAHLMLATIKHYFML